MTADQAVSAKQESAGNESLQDMQLGSASRKITTSSAALPALAAALGARAPTAARSAASQAAAAAAAAVTPITSRHVSSQSGKSGIHTST